MKKNKALSYGLLSLATMIAVPFVAQAGTWLPLNNQPPMPDITDPQTNAFLSEGGAAFPMLLTDGSVIVRNLNSQQVHANSRVLKLTPDQNGSYLNGSWSEIASMPYIPTGNAQAVLADGRVVIEGDEFTGVNLDFTLCSPLRSLLISIHRGRSSLLTPSVTPPAWYWQTELSCSRTR
jgi:hypothetical protein